MNSNLPYDNNFDLTKDFLSNYLSDDNIKNDIKKLKNRESQSKSRKKKKEEQKSDHIILCRIVSDLNEIKFSYANIKNKLKSLETIFTKLLFINELNADHINQLQSSLLKININNINEEYERKINNDSILKTINTIQHNLPYTSHNNYNLYTRESLSSNRVNMPALHDCQSGRLND